MDTAPTADRPKPKSRWFRYRLPATLIVVAAGIGMIWLAVKIKQAHAQRAAVAAILKAGGQVAYEDQDDLSDPANKPRGPEWLRSLLGDDALVQRDAGRSQSSGNHTTRIWRNWKICPASSRSA